MNAVYDSIVSVLQHATLQAIPRIKTSALKFWWDQELDVLKEESIRAHKTWKQAKCPRSGPVFDNYRKAKRQYKLAIKQKSQDENNEVTNDLHDCLLKKDVTSFWKTWNNKFRNNSPKLPNSVDGVRNLKEIAEKFGTYFANICTTSSNFNELAKSKLIESLQKYVGHSSLEEEITIDMVDDIVYSMKRGKASDVDDLTAEHIQFCHPIVITLLRKLFNFMLRYGVLPQGFGRGLIIPVLKAGCFTGDVKCDNFRGITISPIISKIFEHCVLIIYKEHLSSSDSQFGF